MKKSNSALEAEKAVKQLSENQNTGIRKKENGKRRSCTVDFCKIIFYVHVGVSKDSNYNSERNTLFN